MNPCKECMKAYEKTPCSTLGHCAFEGTDINPLPDKIIHVSGIAQRQLA